MSMTNNRKRKTATSSLIGITPPPTSELAYSNEELLLLDRMNRVSFDDEHEYQMSLLKRLKKRQYTRRMEMQSECEAFFAQAFALDEDEAKNMSRLMYDLNYKLPRDYDFYGNPYWQMFLKSKAYRPDLLRIDEFEVNDNNDDGDDDDDDDDGDADDDASLSLMVQRNNTSQRPQVLEPSSALSLVLPRSNVSSQVVGSAAFTKDWIDKIDFPLPKWSPSSFDEFGHSSGYYGTRRAFDDALQVGLEALIERDPDVATICTDLPRSDNGTGRFNIDSHPTFNYSANGTGMIGHYGSDAQGTEGVMTKNGDATCLTYDQLLAAGQKINPNWTLRDLGYTDDLAPVKFPFDNAKGQPFSVMRDVFTKFTEEEWIAVVSTRCQHYCQHFIDLMEQRCKVFKFLFYGDGKYLRPLFEEAFRRAKEYVRTNCNELATILEEVELNAMNVPHWSSVIYPLTQERRLSMDTGIAFLHDIDVALSTYFREGDFTHLQFDKGSGRDMLSCLLAVIKGNSRTDLLVTIMNSDVDEKNPKYSSLIFQILLYYQNSEVTYAETDN